MNDYPSTVNHLLNIESTGGSSGKRLGQLGLFLALVIVPLVIFGLTAFFALRELFGFWGALWALGLPYLLYAIRLGLYIFGNEKARVAYYKQHLDNKYDDPEELLQYKHIHSDGCIEFFDGSIAYMVVALNGNVELGEKFVRVRKWLEVLNDYEMTILVQNVLDNSALDRYRSQIGRFKDKQVARDFLEILDFNQKYIDDNSLVVRTVYMIYGSMVDRVPLQQLLRDVLPITAYFKVHVASKEEILDITAENAGVYIDMDAMLATRYAVNKYFNSRVLYYEKQKGPGTVERVTTLSTDKTPESRRGFIPVYRGDENGSKN